VAYKNVQFLKVDVDEVSSVSSECGVRAMPSFFVYQNAVKVDQLVGPNDKSLEALIKKYNGDEGMNPLKMDNSSININKRSECNVL